MQANDAKRKESPWQGVREGLRGVLPFCKPYQSDWVKGAIALAFSVLLLMPTPLLTKYLIDQVIPSLDAWLILWVCLASITILILSASASYLQRIYYARFEVFVFRDIELALLSKLQKAHPAWRHSQQTGYLLSRVESDPGRLRSLLANALVGLVKDAFILLCGLVVLFTLEWRLTLLALTLLPFFLFTMRYYNLRIRRASSEYYEQGARLTKKLEESISMMDTVVSLSLEGRDSERVRECANESVRSGLRLVRLEGWSGSLISIVGGMAPISIIGCGVWLIMRGEMTLGSLMAFNSFVGYIFGPSSRLSNALLAMQSSIAAWTRIAEILALPEWRSKPTVLPAPTRGLKPIRIELKGVRVMYGETEALHGITLTVEPGSMVALVGPSGCGKSTTLRLLLGTEECAEGELLFDGEPVAGGSQLDRFRVAMLAQEPQLFAVTLAENIGYGSPEETTREALEQATRDAGIWDFISTLPAGLDTPVNERGLSISVGQKQRIALARCMLRDPELLLLDEPTSGLDVEAERLLLDSLERYRANRTVIMAAHRLSTVVNADLIVVMRDGAIVESGSHAMLMARRGLYASMWEHQNRPDDPEVVAG